MLIKIIIVMHEFFPMHKKKFHVSSDHNKICDHDEERKLHTQMKPCIYWEIQNHVRSQANICFFVRSILVYVLMKNMKYHDPLMINLLPYVNCHLVNSKLQGYKIVMLIKSPNHLARSCKPREVEKTMY